MSDRTPYDHDADDLDDLDDLGEYEAYDEDEELDDAEYVELPRTSSRGRRILMVLGGLLALVLARWARRRGSGCQRQIDPPGAAGEPRDDRDPRGRRPPTTSASSWPTRGSSASDFVWDWYLRINGGGPFQAGVYELAENSAMGDVVDILDAGPRPPDERSFTMPEGLTVAGDPRPPGRPREGPRPRRGDHAAAPGQRPGALGRASPPTRHRTRGSSSRRPTASAAGADELSVLQMMVAQLDATMAELDVASAQERFNLTPYEVLIVASLIEEETKVDEERPKVARVIYNRLARASRSGIDATSRYEAELAGRDRGDIDFDSDSPYNTRRRAGLAADPDRQPGPGEHRGRAATRPTARGSTTCSRTPTGTTSSPTATASSWPPSSAARTTGSGCG